MSDNARDRLRRILDQTFGKTDNPMNPIDSPLEGHGNSEQEDPPRCCYMHDLHWLAKALVTGADLSVLTEQDRSDMGHGLRKLIMDDLKRDAQEDMQEVDEALGGADKAEVVVLGGTPADVEGLVANLRAMGMHNMADLVAKTSGLAEEQDPVRKFANREAHGVKMTLLPDGSSLKVGETTLKLTPEQSVAVAGTILGWVWDSSESAMSVIQQVVHDTRADRPKED